MTTTASVIERLHSDREFNTFLRNQARRHFSNTTDREEAVAEAWSRLCAHLSYADFQRVAYNAIQNYYRRNTRLMNHERDQLIEENLYKA